MQTHTNFVKRSFLTRSDLDRAEYGVVVTVDWALDSLTEPNFLVIGNWIHHPDCQDVIRSSTTSTKGNQSVFRLSVRSLRSGTTMNYTTFAQRRISK